MYAALSFCAHTEDLARIVRSYKATFYRTQLYTADSYFRYAFIASHCSRNRAVAFVEQFCVRCEGMGAREKLACKGLLYYSTVLK